MQLNLTNHCQSSRSMCELGCVQVYGYASEYACVVVVCLHLFFFGILSCLVFTDDFVHPA